MPFIFLGMECPCFRVRAVRERHFPLVPKLRLGNGLPGKLQLRLAVTDLNDCRVFDRSRLLAMR